MKFRTEIKINPFPFSINHSHTITGLGSCFVNNVSEKLTFYKFNTNPNPAGIIYNPYSIANQCSMRMTDEEMETKELITAHGRYFHPYFHSQISGSTKKACYSHIKDALNSLQTRLRNTDILLLTLGTAWVYRSRLSGKIVANCHKQPQHSFTKELLSINDILQSLHKIQDSLPSQAQIILTISPVRHTRDGITENLRSKARLIEAAHIFQESVKQTHYFPAYEIMMDDLRDYRYYAEDLVHPNNQAIQYIWEAFQSAFFSPETRDIVKYIHQINMAMAHKPFQIGSKEYKDFKKANRAKIEKLASMYPYLNWDEENSFFK